jgi:hypothetical protein
MDKWPWDIWMGSQFTVNFQDAKRPGLGSSPGAKMARIGDLLQGKHKKEAEQIQNSANRKIKVPLAEEYNKEMGLEFADSDDAFILNPYREKSQPVRFARKVGDLWLRIVDLEDVIAWAGFLAAWLPVGLRCFAKLEGEQYMW